MLIAISLFLSGLPLGWLLDRDEMLVLAADTERGLAVRGRQRLLVGLRDEVDPPGGEHRLEHAVKGGPRNVRQALAQLPELHELAAAVGQRPVGGLNPGGQVAVALGGVPPLVAAPRAGLEGEAGHRGGGLGGRAWPRRGG